MPILLLVVNNVNFLYSHRLPVVLKAAKKGYEVHIATCFDDTEKLRHTDKLTYHYIHFNRNSTNPLRDIKCCFQLYLLYKKLRPDLIHHVGMKPILYGSLIAKLRRSVPYINAISGLGYLFINDSLKSHCVRYLLLLGFRFGFQSTHCHFIFQNNDDYDLFKARGILKNNKVTFIRGSGVDLEQFFPVQKVHENLIIMFPARLLWDKGIAEFVNAARILKNKKSRFILVGDIDPLNPASVSLDDIQGWLNEGIIEHWGWHNDMPAIFKEADIVCLPSYREGLPKSLLEAAASGCPIVTTEAPGCRDVVEEGINGFLVPVRDHELLAERLSTLIDSSLLREQMGKASRERAEKLFDIKQVVEQHLLLYDNMTIRRPRESRDLENT